MSLIQANQSPPTNFVMVHGMHPTIGLSKWPKLKPTPGNFVFPIHEHNALWVKTQPIPGFRLTTCRNDDGSSYANQRNFVFSDTLKKKPGYLLYRQPGYFLLKPVVFRPHLTMGLALFGINDIKRKS